MRLVFLALLLCLSQPPVAGNEINCRKSASESCEALHHVIWVTNEDHRKTIPDFARANNIPVDQFERTTKATGVINCGGREYTAQITGKSNVLTTAGHAFWRPDCRKVELKLCGFRLDNDPNAFEYGLKSEITEGCPFPDMGKDWAVAKLKMPVPRVTPYDIPSSDIAFSKDKPIRQISAKHENFVVSGSHPKTAENCFWRDPSPFHANVIQHDCNTGLESSGSAQFVREDGTNRFVIGAIHVAERINGNLPGTGYDRMGLYNLSVPLSGAFRAAVMESQK